MEKKNCLCSGVFQNDIFHYVLLFFAYGVKAGWEIIEVEMHICTIKWHFAFFFVGFIDCSWQVNVRCMILLTHCISKQWKLKKENKGTWRWRGRWSSKKKILCSDGHTKHLNQVYKVLKESYKLASEYAGKYRRGKNNKRGCLRT